ncbi:GRF-type domain-containing protein [Heracleum sosnowskyi]|uniref:GRF-type domain-containing protein n=1 Tax=Heracleum sosnowskyi TaxID=360622 RepID=A0AAD8IV04_9APIA|nr:GRF-type domain-containing protein [Heracleum sosnowskyi]
MSENENGKWDWGCKHFLWEDVLKRSCSGSGAGSGSSSKGTAGDGPATMGTLPSTLPPTPSGSSTPTPTTEEKRIKALSKALEISQMANRALVDLIHDLALDDN